MKSYFSFLLIVGTVGLVVNGNVRVPRLKLDSNNPSPLEELGREVLSAELSVWNRFLEFVQKFDKQYEDVDEARQRFLVFRQNFDELSRKNQLGGSSTVTITQFFDFTREEFRQRFLGLKLSHPKRSADKHDLTESDIEKYRSIDEPDSLDWRANGYVSSVKNQGQCGSCFTFGAIGAVEGQWFKKTGKLISLSEEQVLDCGDDQCGGGDPLHVYDTIAEEGGVESEEAYSYVAGNGQPSNCSFDEKKFVAYTNGSRAIPIHDEELLGKVLTIEGPVEVNINAEALFDYESGILDPDQDPGHHVEDVNHAVLLVGYGVEKQIPFWIIKNSWGTKFGEDGYFRVKRGTNRLFITDSNPSLPLIL